MQREIGAEEVTQELLSDPAFLNGEYVFVIRNGLAMPGFDTTLTREKMSRMSSLQQMMQKYSGDPVTLRYLTTKLEVSSVKVTVSSDTIIKLFPIMNSRKYVPDLKPII